MFTFFPNLLHILLIPAFFLLCLLLYEPGPIGRLLTAGEGEVAISNIVSFNTAIISAILLLTMIISRLCFYFFGRKMGMNIMWYVGWCFLEVVLMSAFMALYLALMTSDSGDYFIMLGRSLSYLASILIYPYVIVLLIYGYSDAMHRSERTEESAKLSFYDNRHLLKFVTRSELVLYLESDENYIFIHYLDNGAHKKYQLRNSLKTVEGLCEKAGFVRIHRGYIVNPAHVKLIRKVGGGAYSAILGEGVEQEIPVSKKYYDKLMSLL